MILGLHVAIALLSMAWAGYTLFAPSQTKIRVSYVLMAATLGTGTYLVIVAPAHMLQACMSGVAYLVVVACMTAFAQRKLKHAVASENA